MTTTRNHTCLDCKNTWAAVITLSPSSPAVSGEKMEQCPACDSRNVMSSPAVEATNYTIETIRDEMQSEGSHWWDRSSMRFFRCRVCGGVFQGEGGIFFVTSEKSGDTAPRMYSVRQYIPATKQIETIGDFNSIRSLSTAKRQAEKLAGAPMQAEPALREETAAEELARLLTKDGGCFCNVTMASWLIRLATAHHKMTEDACSFPGCEMYDEEGEPTKKVANLLASIKAACQNIGAKGAEISGDPRGCTVKIVCPTGFTNDWAKEGVCVPTAE